MTPLLARVLADEPKRTSPVKISLVNGPNIRFWSDEREDSLRGGGVDFLMLDETVVNEPHMDRGASPDALGYAW
jgi:hypothetical protein